MGTEESRLMWSHARSSAIARATFAARGASDCFSASQRSASRGISVSASIT